MSSGRTPGRHEVVSIGRSFFCHRALLRHPPLMCSVTFLLVIL
jgi:hypothetical protein